MTHQEITELLHKEIVPVTGCTGPTAYALAAAACRSYVTGKIRSYKIFVSPAYLKMGFGVATPGTKRTGIAIATAAGFIGGEANLGMQVLLHTTAEHIRMASEMADSGIFRIAAAEGETGVYVRNEIVTDRETVLSVVRRTHDGLSLIQVNGENVFVAPPAVLESRIEDHPDSLSLRDIYAYAESCTPEKTAFLMDNYRVNLALAEDGLRGGYGLQTGRALLMQTFHANTAYRPATGTARSLFPVYPKDLFEDPFRYLPKNPEERMNILVCAASDARMGGSRLPASAAMGDGNQGITLLLPIGVYGESLGKTDAEITRAMAFGALMLFYVKMHIGRAAAMCLCAIAASAGAAAGIGFLKGLERAQIEAAVKNVISPLAGMLCDGAKNACALKMSIAAKSAVQSVELASLGVEAGYFDGVCDDSLEDTVLAITDIANETMDFVDDCMVRTILKKQERRAQKQ